MKARLQEETIKGTLARLEVELAGVEQDDLLRESVHARLRSFLVNLSTSPDDAETPPEELGSLSNVEIFELIDEEFGKKDSAEPAEEHA